ncbi:hypothetical protein DSECCO2_374580 [anaerobic digester metagenome]
MVTQKLLGCGTLACSMIDDQTILLRQIIDELKQQNASLFSINKRLESLEMVVGRDLSNVESAIDRIQVRGD